MSRIKNQNISSITEHNHQLPHTITPVFGQPLPFSPTTASCNQQYSSPVMAFQGGRRMASRQWMMRHRRYSLDPPHERTILEKRRLVTDQHPFQISSSSSLKSTRKKNVGLKRPSRRLRDKRWYTDESFAAEEANWKGLESRKRGSKTIATLSILFAGAVLLEGNAKQGWIGQQTVLPREYNRPAIDEYWRQRPISILRRLGRIMSELGPIWVRFNGYKNSPFASKSNPHEIDSQLEEQVIRALGKDLKQALPNLGPAWIKAGQHLATRHPVLSKELENMSGAVNNEIMSQEEALEILQNELGDKAQNLHELKLVASASLGQVYKGKLIRKDMPGFWPIPKSETVVAIKIQRPGILESFSLDLFLMQAYGNVADAFDRELLDSFSQKSYMELDYEHNAKKMKEGGLDRKVPKVFETYTTQRVLVTEWMD